MQTAARDTKRRARKLAWTIVLGVMSCIMALVGIGLVTSWLFMTLSIVFEPRWAALLIGVGFIFLSVVIFMVAAKSSSKSEAKRSSTNRSQGIDAETPDGAVVIAFTAAFVLARYLTDRKRS